MRAFGRISLSQRFAASALLLALTTVTLGGCGLLRGGQSVNHANSSTALPEGVEKVAAEYRSTLEGFTTSYFVEVDVTISDDFVISDGGAFVEWAARLGWSINEHDPVSVSLQVFSSDGNGAAWDYSSAVEEFGFAPEDAVSRFGDPPRLYFNSTRLTPLFGDWPGDVPETPSGMLTPAT